MTWYSMIDSLFGILGYKVDVACHDMFSMIVDGVLYDRSLDVVVFGR